MNIYVTGCGVVCGIGNDARECIENIKAGKTGIAFDETTKLMLAKVNLSDDDIIQILGLPSKKYSRTTLLGTLAAKEAWGNNISDCKIRTGLISGTSVGGIDRMEEYYIKTLKEKTDKYYPLMIFDNGSETENIARYLGISGYIDTIATACSSSANAILQGAELIRNNILDRVIVGSADPFSQYTIKGFSSLGIYDSNICRPFDENRNGLNLGEGAAYLVLENEKSLAITKNQPLCLLTGWNNSSDAFHQTASSPDGKGAALTMQKSIEKAGLLPSDIDYVNAHGTGTPNNDLSESIALKTVFKNEVPPFSSTKGFTGHTLAAAGAIEAIFSIQSLIEQFYLPNINFNQPISELGMTPVTEMKTENKINNILSNSFGFGGNCTSLLFSKLN